MGSSSSSATDPEYQEGQIPDMMVPHSDGVQPKAGDLIEIFRPGYQHWAVYIGGGYVVHLVVDGKRIRGGNVPEPRGMGVVLKQKLEEVVGKHRWRINNSLDKKYKHQKVYTIVKQAIEFIDTQLPYNVIKSNCEHFVTDLRYGKPESRQVIRVGAGVGGALAGLVAVVGAVATVVGLIRR